MRRLGLGVVAMVVLSFGGSGHAQRQGKCPAECQMNCPHAGGGGPAARGGGWMNGPYARIYDSKTVETMKGEVAVHLGPAWYLDNQEVQLAKGDRVEVRGSRVTVDGKPALVAAEVKKGSETLTVRDANGLPMWRGWR